MAIILGERSKKKKTPNEGSPLHDILKRKNYSDKKWRERSAAKEQEGTLWGNVLCLGCTDGYTTVCIVQTHPIVHWKRVIFILNKLYLIKAGVGEGKAKPGAWHQGNTPSKLLILFLFSCHLEW